MSAPTEPRTERCAESLPSASDDIITKIEYFRVPPRWLFVRVETSSGIVGWGEATLEGHTEAVEGSMKDLARRFVGWPTDNIEDIWQHGFRARFYRGGEVLMSAMSGLDIALWDIKGKRMGVPVWSLLGGAVRSKIPVYCWIGGDRPADILEEAKIRKAAGFKAVKMNATEDLGWLDSPKQLDASVERLKLAQSVGLDVGMDFHGRVHRPMAKQLALLLAPHRPLFIEEPLLHGHINEIASLARQTGVPIALGERMYTRQDFRPYFEAGAVDIVQPDVSHAGGISECKRIADFAATYDVGFAPHCPNGPIALAASFHMDISAPNFVIQEMSYRIHYNTTADLGTYILNPEIFEVVDGMVAAPTAPGLGLVMNEELIRARSLEAEPWGNPVWRGKDGYLREW
ncbi:enolase C-terminal domain-like protein [Mrakia frigida]|uniref:enolase C-terminal domain-like protein n=1 Tax=Mrakia frigida TaxID=29902 RepID=UPI003FCC213F